MPNAFRAIDGTLWKAGQLIPLTLPDGSVVTEKWAGSATEEKLAWWLRPSTENVLAHTPAVAAIGTDDGGEPVWADAPEGACAFFVITAPEPGKDYRLAKMVTTAASPAMAAWIGNDRFALLGTPRPNGGFVKVNPPDPPEPPPRPQLELF